MVLEEEEPQEEDIDGSIIVKDNNVVSVDATVSSITVLLEPIPIPAPGQASMHIQQAVEG